MKRGHPVPPLAQGLRPVLARTGEVANRVERKLLRAGGGGMKAHFLTPPPQLPPPFAALPGPFPSHRQASGRRGRGVRITPYMTQYNPHDALIILSHICRGENTLLKIL